MQRNSMHRALSMAVKRSLDVLIGCICLAILAIPFALVALAIKLDSRGSVFFRQERIGKDGRPFRIWKFRTMIQDAVNQGLGVTVSRGDWRITRVGNVLRNWGLDELPQLINVVLGQMSIVGPRPTLGYQVERYNAFQRQRLLMRPGITSLAVVRGRNNLSWEERIRIDVQYVKDWSLWLDLRIIFLTFWKILVTKEGLYGENGVNDDFTGQVVAPRVGEDR